MQIDGHTLTLSNLTKVLYPADGFTKAEVLDYYQRISAVLLPHIAGRPMTLKRYPEGVDAESFFAKHAPAHRPDWIRTEDVESRSSRSREPGAPVSYLVIDDLAALIWAANLAGLELHVPMWRFPGREPDLARLRPRPRAARHGGGLLPGGGGTPPAARGRGPAAAAQDLGRQGPAAVRGDQRPDGRAGQRAGEGAGRADGRASTPARWCPG